MPVQCRGRAIARPLAGRGSGGSLEPLFDPGAGDDLLTIAEPQPGTKGPMLVPEAVESFVDRADLGSHLRVVSVGQPVPELSPLLAQAFDLLVDLFDGSHG